MDSNSHFPMASLEATMEDLSLKQNQLLYRQQTEKPLLKYSNSEPGPIYLYQNPDLKRDMISSALSGPPKVLASKKGISSTHGNPASSKHFSPTQYNYVPSADPYARPLSAKDLMTVGIERTKSLSHIMNSTLAGSITGEMHATNINNNTLFIPSKPTDLTKASHLDSASASQHNNNSNNHNVLSTTKVVSVHSPESNTIITQSAKEKFEASLSKPPIALDRGARPPSALRRPNSSTVRNPNYSPVKPYEGVSEDEDFKMVSDQKSKKKTDDNLNNKITKAISSLSRSNTSVKQLSFSSLPSSAQTPSNRSDAENSSASTSVTTPTRQTKNVNDQHMAAGSPTSQLRTIPADIIGSRPDFESTSTTSHYKISNLANSRASTAMGKRKSGKADSASSITSYYL